VGWLALLALMEMPASCDAATPRWLDPLALVSLSRRVALLPVPATQLQRLLRRRLLPQRLLPRRLLLLLRKPRVLLPSLEKGERGTNLPSATLTLASRGRGLVTGLRTSKFAQLLD
jgi:hypothetical protein